MPIYLTFGVILVKTGAELSIGEKIKQVRESMGVKQNYLADEIAYTNGRLSQIENGDDSGVPPDFIFAVKAALKIENAPFNAIERESFKDNLSLCKSLIEERNLSEANKLISELSVITYLPFDQELNAYFDIVKCRLLLAEGDLESVKTILSTYDIHENALDNDILYQYYYSKGAYFVRTGEYENAFESYKKAKSVMQGSFKENPSLHYSIAYCLTALGHSMSAILFLEKDYELYSENQGIVSQFQANNMLGTQYARLRYFDEAKLYLGKALKYIKTTDNKLYTGIALHNHGFLYRQTGDWGTAIKYLNEAFPYIDENSTLYLENLYLMARCYIGMESNTKYSDLLNKGYDLSRDNENYTILFKSLNHLATISKHESRQYIVEITIPHLLKKHEIIPALDYCCALKTQYEKKGIGTVSRALKVEKIYSELLEKMQKGGVV